MTYTTLVSTADLAENIENPDWIVFDCRFTLTDPAAGKKKYNEGHIPGAIYAHLDDDLAAPVTSSSGRHPLPDVNSFADKLGQWGVDKNKQVVVYDDTFGAMACRMWWLLRWLGHDNVALLDGVYPKWLKEKRAADKNPPNLQASKFVPQVQDESVVDAGFIQQHMAEDGSVLIDARPDIRFTGEIEPIDKVAGHIPGAINRPFDDNLDIGGDFMSLEELKEDYAALLKNKNPSQVIHMCGSGVTACHNILAMECLGFKNTRLYAGSWSHWITDENRAVATGE
jgi:thiosulfate/3-mercaptopyruvate sulfurtransferase